MERVVAGIVATVFTVSMKLPQIYHSIKTKRTKDISIWFLLLDVLNHIAWLVYAVFDNMNIPLIICDSVSIMLSFVLLGFKYKYDHRIVEL